MRTIAFAFVAQAVALLAQTGTAGIQGTVTDATNKKAVPTAFVTAIRTDLPAVSKTATTAAGGIFQITGLPPGTYSLCIQVPAGSYLDPCQWANLPVKLTLSAGQNSTSNALKVTSGSELKVRVDDPNQALSQKTKDGRHPDINLGVIAPNGFLYRLHARGKDKTGADYQLIVPRDFALTLKVVSKDLKLADSTGAALTASGDQQAFRHNTGDATPKSFKYTVTGLVP